MHVVSRVNPSQAIFLKMVGMKSLKNPSQDALLLMDLKRAIDMGCFLLFLQSMEEAILPSNFGRAMSVTISCGRST